MRRCLEQGGGVYSCNRVLDALRHGLLKDCIGFSLSLCLFLAPPFSCLLAFLYALLYPSMYVYLFCFFICHPSGTLSLSRLPSLCFYFFHSISVSFDLYQSFLSTLSLPSPALLYLSIILFASLFLYLYVYILLLPYIYLYLCPSLYFYYNTL